MGTSKEFPASEVLAKIKAGQLAEFDNCIIVGEVPNLEMVQPYSSDAVKTKAKELYEYAKTNMHEKKGALPSEILDRVLTELCPIIKTEIEEITNQNQGIRP